MFSFFINFKEPNRMNANFNRKEIETIFGVSHFVANSVLEICKLSNSSQAHPLELIAQAFDPNISHEPYFDFAKHDIFFGLQVLTEPRKSKPCVAHFLKRSSPFDSTFFWIVRPSGYNDFYISSYADFIEFPVFFNFYTK